MGFECPDANGSFYTRGVRGAKDKHLRTTHPRTLAPPHYRTIAPIPVLTFR